MSKSTRSHRVGQGRSDPSIVWTLVKSKARDLGADQRSGRNAQRCAILRKAGPQRPRASVRRPRHAVCTPRRDVAVQTARSPRLQRAGQGFTVTSHLGGRSPRGYEAGCSRAGVPPTPGGAQNRNRSAGRSRR